MRKTTLVLAVAILGLALPLAAQDPDPPGPRAGELRRQIEERFTARVKEDLGLDERQTSRLREVVGSYFLKRRNLEADERRLRQLLASELRPGVAANKENVGRLTEQLLDNKVKYVESYRDEVRELATFLDPVQRAQFLILRERLLDRIREAQDEAQQQRRDRRGLRQ